MDVVDVTLGDIIVGIDDVDIMSEADLFKALDLRKVGETVSVRILRAVDSDSSGGDVSGNGVGKTGNALRPAMTVKRVEMTVKLKLGEKAE